MAHSADLENAFFGHEADGQNFTLVQVIHFMRQTEHRINAVNLKKYVEDRVAALPADTAITDEHKTALKTAILVKMGFAIDSNEYFFPDMSSVDSIEAFLRGIDEHATNFRALYDHVIAQPGVQLGALRDVRPQQGVNAEQSKGFWGDAKWTSQSVKDILSVGGGYSDPAKTIRDRDKLRSFVRQRVETFWGNTSKEACENREALVRKLAIPVDGRSCELTREQALVIEQLADVKNDIQLQMIAKNSFWPSSEIQDNNYLTDLSNGDRGDLKGFVEERVNLLMGGHDVSDHDIERAKNAVLHHLGFAVDTTTNRALTAAKASQAFEAIGKLTTPQAMGAFAVANLAPLDKLAKDIANTSSNSDKWEFVQAFLAAKMVEKGAASSIEEAKAQTEALRPYFMTRHFGSFRKEAKKDLREIVKDFVANIPAVTGSAVDLNNVAVTNWYQRMQLANQAQIKGGMSAQQCADYCETVVVLTPGGDKEKLRGHLEAIKSKHDGGYAELALTGLDSAQPAQVLGVIKSKFQRDADRQEKAQHDEKRRLKLIAEGKYRNQESGWGYCDSAEEAGKLAIALNSKSLPLEDVLVVSASHQHDLLRLGRAFDNVTWVEYEVDDETISIPGEGADCKSVQAYMAHAKQELGEAKWTAANQQAVYAYAMARIAEVNTTFAQSCMDVQDAYPGKQWVLTPSARQAMGLAADFSLETARQQAFNIMHENVDCRFVRDLKSYKVPSQPDTAAGLAPAPPDLTLEKLRKHPQLQEAFWREYWARVYKKPSYALDEQGRPKVGANLDGSTVLHYGKGVFAKVNHNGCSKSNGIHSQEEANHLVAAMISKRKLDNKSENPDQPLMAYGKNTKSIQYLLNACFKNGVRVRIDQANPVAKRALKKCSQEVQDWVNLNLPYSKLIPGGTTPIHGAGRGPEDSPGSHP